MTPRGRLLMVTELRARDASGAALRFDGLRRAAEDHFDVETYEVPSRSQAPLLLRNRPGELGRSLVDRADGCTVVYLSGLAMAPLLRHLREHATVLDMCDDWRLQWEHTSRLGRLSRQVLEKEAGSASVWTFISARDARRLTSSNKHATALVPSGIPPELLQMPPPDENALGLAWLSDWSYGPNADGLAFYLREVAPLVAGGEIVTLYGPHPPGLEVSPHARYAGFAPSLASAYGGARAVLALMSYGSGVKTKVVEGLAAGRVVITTPEGAAGLPGSNALLVCRSADDVVAALGRVQRMQAEELADLAARGRRSMQTMTWEAAGQALRAACLQAMTTTGKTPR